MRGLDHLRELVGPTVEKSAAERLGEVGKTLRGGDDSRTGGGAKPSPTLHPTHVVGRIADEHAVEAARAMLGAGARRVGKRLVLHLGSAQVTYAHAANEFVGKTERGRIEAQGADARDVLDRIGLSGLLDTVDSDG